MGFFLVMKAEIVRSWIVTRRYWFRTLVSMFIGYGMLIALIFAIANGNLTSKIEDPTKAMDFVLGFIIGIYAFGIIGMFTQGLQGMATSGILEQLCMSPHGLVTNFLARCTVAAISTVLSSGVMLYFIGWTVGGSLHFDPIAVPILLMLTFINLIGFGFMAGGLVLVFKQVGQVALIVRMGLLGLAVFAQEEFLQHGILVSLLMHTLPIVDAAICLKLVMLPSEHTFTMLDLLQHQAFAGLLISCVVWMFIGITVFKYLEDYSRSKGTLGAY